MVKGLGLLFVVAGSLLAGCVDPDGSPTERWFSDLLNEWACPVGQGEAEFTAPFRDHVASVEIHRDEVRVIPSEDELAGDIVDEVLRGLYCVHQWYKEVGILPSESRALFNASEYVRVSFDEVQYFDFVFKESDMALDSIVILLEVGDAPRSDFIDHVVTCLDLHCQRFISDDNVGRRERLDAMTFDG